MIICVYALDNLMSTTSFSQTVRRLEELAPRIKRRHTTRAAMFDRLTQISNQIHLITDESAIDEMHEGLKAVAGVGEAAIETEDGLPLIPASAKDIRNTRSLEELPVFRKRKAPGTVGTRHDQHVAAAKISIHPVQVEQDEQVEVQMVF